MTRTKSALFSTAAIVIATMAFATSTPIKAHADDSVTIVAADPNEHGDGTMGPAAAAARARGPLPFSAADVAGKEAADRAYAAAARSGALRPSSPSELAAAGQSASMQAPTVVGTLNFAGQSGGTASTNVSPPDNEGAIGTTRYIQTINDAVRIYNRTTKVAIASGTLNQLAHNAASVNSFDPQIIWDPTTNRFYYTMDSIFSSTDNRLAFGFSKTASPGNATTDWCHYYVKYGTPFPDYPKLGDMEDFIIIGVNVFNPNFVGSDIVAVEKPTGAGTIATCPAANTFSSGKKVNLKDTGNNQVFTPVPANQIDTIATGYVVARNGGLPATKLWFFNVTKNVNGAPVFGNARGATVASYTFPPNAAQPNPGGAFGQLIDTLDGRNTQAIQGRNIARAGTVQSFWTQHTIGSGALAAVRWYEINPVPAVPVVLRSGTIAAANTFLFNAAISPDRKVRGATTAFGDSFVIQYNVTKPVSNIGPRIVAASSLHGAALSAAVLIKNGVGPYRDFTCPSSGNVCRWGDYAAATPDPAPTTTGTGEVWGTNQFSGVTNPPAGGVNWRTQIFAIKP